MKSIAVIANPFAGTTRGRLSGPDAISLLEKSGFSCTLCLTEAAGHAKSLAIEAADKHDLVVAVGGDGTIHEVASGLVGTDCPLGVLPSGSGNDFATGIGCGSVQEGLAAITEGSPQQIDVCGLDGKPFINSMGFLASGEISGTASRLWRWLGSFRYVVASLGTILSYRGQDVEWNIKDADSPGSGNMLSGRFLLAEFCNGPLTGGGFKLAKAADLSDGLMDLCLVKPVGLIALLGILPGAAAGREIEHPAFVRCQSRGVEFFTDEPVAFHLDGEPGMLAEGSHVVEVLDQKLKVMMLT